MTFRILCGFLFIFCSSLTYAQDAAPPMEHGLEYTEFFQIASEHTGLTYDITLYVHPKILQAYDKNPDIQVPILYFLDSQWSFQTMHQAQSVLYFEEQIEQAIVVGIGYGGDWRTIHDRRAKDHFAPFVEMNTKSGGGEAEHFLDFIEFELTKKLEHNKDFTRMRVKADPNRRGIYGVSTSGTFVLYSLLSRPHLFKTYMTSGSNVLDGYGKPVQGFIDMKDQFVKKNNPFSSDDQRHLVLYTAGLDNALIKGTREWIHSWAEKDEFGLKFDSKMIENESHASVGFVMSVDGLRTAYPIRN